MPGRLHVLVYENEQKVKEEKFDGPVCLGRQRDLKGTLYSKTREGNCWRWVIASTEETSVGRNQAILETLEGRGVRIRNGSTKQPIAFDGLDMLYPGQTCDLQLPVRMTFCSPRTYNWRTRPERSMSRH